MRLFFGGCPRANDLEAMARSRPVSARVARHVSTCTTCRQIVEDLQRDATLLAQLREAATTGLNDSVHEHVIDICREVASEVRRVSPS